MLSKRPGPRCAVTAASAANPHPAAQQRAGLGARTTQFKPARRASAINAAPAVGTQCKSRPQPAPRRAQPAPRRTQPKVVSLQSSCANAWMCTSCHADCRLLGLYMIWTHRRCAGARAVHSQPHARATLPGHGGITGPGHGSHAQVASAYGRVSLLSVDMAANLPTRRPWSTSLWATNTDKSRNVAGTALQLGRASATRSSHGASRRPNRSTCPLADVQRARNKLSPRQQSSRHPNPGQGQGE